MKLINKITVAITAVLMTGCYSLDQSPYDEIGVENTFNTIYDAESWRVGVYSKIRQSAYGENMYLTDIQSDLLNATPNALLASSLTTVSEFHRWETLTASNDNLKGIWIGAYSAIANINTAIEGFKNIQTNSEKQEQLLRYYTGEMYLARAYYYSRLATLFCKAYDESTASTDLGLPMPLVYDITARHKRKTLKETYEQILSDIEQAEKLLAGKANYIFTELLPSDPQQFQQLIISFTDDSVKALKARVLLYMKRWSDAYAVANAFIQEGTYYLASSEGSLQQEWHYDGTMETITQLYASTKELPGRNDIYNLMINFNGAIYNRAPFIPSQWVIDLYEDSDIRKNVYFKKDNLAAGDSSFNDIYVVNKYPGNPNLWVGSSTNYAHAPKIFRIAEVYLIAAEAAYHSGNDALTPLNALKNARGLTSSTLSGAALYEEIQNERLREMAFEGTRLFDLRRWGKGVKRHSSQNQAAIITDPAAQYHELDRPAGDNKSVWGIYSGDIEIVDKSQQNPGW